MKKAPNKSYLQKIDIFQKKNLIRRKTYVGK